MRHPGRLSQILDGATSVSREEVTAAEGRSRSKGKPEDVPVWKEMSQVHGQTGPAEQGHGQLPQTCRDSGTSHLCSHRPSQLSQVTQITARA